MNTPMVNHAFRFVKSIFRTHLPHGFRDFQFDQTMDFKNDLIGVGLQHNLPDSTLELLALAALLQNTGCIEGQFEKRATSQTIAQKFLAEKGYPPERTGQVLRFIAVTCPTLRPRTRVEQLIQASRFKQSRRINAGHAVSDTIADLWP